MKNEFIEVILDSLPLIVFCKKYEVGMGHFVYWNKMAEEVFGHKASDIIGKTDFDLFEYEQAKFFQEKDLETLSKMEQIFIDCEEICHSIDKENRQLSTWKTPIVIGNEKYILGVSLDITIQKNLEHTLQKEREQKVENSRLAALGEMAGGIAHEINNPLAILSGNMQTLSKLVRNDNLDPERIERISQKSMSTLDRITKIIHSLKALSRHEDKVDNEGYSIEEIIDEVSSISTEKFKSNGVDYKVIIPENCPKISCQKISLSQVILNLLNNAYDALSEMEINNKWIKVEVKKGEEVLYIIVSDCGKGIQESVVKKIFNPFFTTKDIGKGTGLGLSLSKGLIEKQGGVLRYDPYAKNTTFVIEMNYSLIQEDINNLTH